MQNIRPPEHPVCCGITVILGFILGGVLGAVIFTHDPDLVTEAMQNSAETICEAFNAYNGTNSTSTNSTLSPLLLTGYGMFYSISVSFRREPDPRLITMTPFS